METEKEGGREGGQAGMHLPVVDLKCRENFLVDPISEKSISIMVFLSKAPNTRLVGKIMGPIQDIQSLADENFSFILKNTARKHQHLQCLFSPTPEIHFLSC